MLIRMTTTPGNIHFFANLFKVSPRTIQREIQMLRNKGFPIVIDRETGVVQVVSDYGIPPVGFTLGEAVAMVVLFEEYGEHIKEPVFSSIRTACYKLISSLPADTLTQMSGIQNCLTVLPRNTQVENDDEKTF
ncbi:MAG: HTH domain-containing protein [Planctomycetia bacterium]|nr:HTH domain-containing protein [Planctomycetia bacterium]